jgi:hypothetical protein
VCCVVNLHAVYKGVLVNELLWSVSSSVLSYWFICLWFYRNTEVVSNANAEVLTNQSFFFFYFVIILGLFYETRILLPVMVI